MRKDRGSTILKLVNDRKKIEVTELAEAIGVSGVTIRKDLDKLEAEGLLKREHGYACAVSSDDINNRLANNYEIKRRIAIAACDIVNDGETVMIESGSTCAILAELLTERKRDISFITNSVFIANRLRRKAKGTIMLLGGELQRESEVCVGPLIRTQVKSFYADKIFLGTDGLVEGVGFTCGNLQRAEAVQSMAQSAKKRIILTDSSKFSEHGLVLQLALDDVSSVYTDSCIPGEVYGMLTDSGINVIRIEADS